MTNGLTIDDIRKIADDLLTNIGSRGIQGVNCDNVDLYWRLDSSDMFSVEQDADVIVGSFIEDVEELAKLKDNIGWVSPVDLERLSAVFLCLAKLVEET